MIKNPFRIILLVTIIFLLLKNLAMLVLLGDFGSIIPAVLHVVLLYLIITKHNYTLAAISFWALFYLLVYTGVKAGGKTLVILGGNGWEINNLRYGIDLTLVFIGIIVLLLRTKMVTGSYKNKEE